MTLKHSHTLLLVDDEASILKSLQRVFRKEGHTLFTATSGPEALEILSRAPETFSLIISDQRMPEMTGAEFLERAVVIAPDAMRFTLTGYSDLDAVIDAVNKGRIHQYITKPWDDEGLIKLVNSALAQVELYKENNRLRALTEKQNQELAELNKILEKKVSERTWALQIQNKQLQHANANLEKNLLDIIHLLVSLVESSHPRLGRYMKAVARLAKDLAADAGFAENARQMVEMAGLVHDIGLIGMSEDILEKDTKIMTAEEFASYSQHPTIAAVSLSSFNKFKEICDIVVAHHEHFDGGGFPQGLEGDQIPEGAKILAVAADYCTILHLWPAGIQKILSMARRYLDQGTVAAMDITDPDLRKNIAERIIEQGSHSQYDPDATKLLLKRLADQRPFSGVLRLSIQGLKSGMILMQDLRLNDGRLLLSRSTLLDERLIQSIQGMIDRDLFEGLIEVAEPNLQYQKPDKETE